LIDGNLFPSLAHPATVQQQARRAVCSAAVSYLLIYFFIFNHSCKTDYLNIYRTVGC